MTQSSNLLSINKTISPHSVDEVLVAVREAYEKKSPLYPLGGQTSLNYGRLPTEPGVGLDLSKLDQVISYTPRDMTITVQAGIKISDLNKLLLTENQQLPIDLPNEEFATVGGAIATNAFGPRRAGHGTWRDYVIGISAVDGHGTLFKAGGQVVKNVAGYDFCKLLTGSLGTLGVITQVTLRVKPIAAQTVTLLCDCSSLPRVEKLFEALHLSAVSPVMIDLLRGPGWQAELEKLCPNQTASKTTVVIRYEGSNEEIAWISENIPHQLQPALASPASANNNTNNTPAASSLDSLTTAQAESLFILQRDFSQYGLSEHRSNERSKETETTILKITVLPSQVVSAVEHLEAVFSAAKLETEHGINLRVESMTGVILVEVPKIAPTTLNEIIIQQLQPWAAQAGGTVLFLVNHDASRTSQVTWGGPGSSLAIMEAVKEQFDPHKILNRGRFIYND